MVTQPGRILVVEDDTRTAELIALYLRHAGHRVWVEGHGGRARERLRAEPFDLVILDRMLPGVDGMTLCRELTAEHGLPVIMVTARTLEEERIEGFEGGADDYVTKPFSPRELVARANALLRRAPPGERDQVMAGPLCVDLSRHRVSLDDVPVELTPSEFEILRALAEQPGRVCSRAALLDRLPARGRDALERTVDVHVRNLRRKLGAVIAAPDDLVETVFGVGYRLGTGRPS
ncbi:MAG: response regulator transcription factor [Gemmatimonadota bacterium]